MSSLPYDLPFDLPGTLSAGTAESRDQSAPSTGRDLAIDLNTRELIVEEGDVTFVRDAEAVKQNVNIQLNLFLGEWYLDEEEGVAYFERVLVKSPDLAAIKSLLTAEILKVAGIVAVVSLDLVHDREERVLNVKWAAQYDLTVISDSLTLNV